MAADDPLAYMMPKTLSGTPEINKQDIRLEIDAKTVVKGSGGAHYARLIYTDGHTESCIAVRRKTSQAFEIFEALNACSHKSIAKPIGVWENKKQEMGYIVFPNFEGLLSFEPKEAIFEVENQSEAKPALQGFSKMGFNILSDVMSAVNYVNGHYQQNSIPLKSLRIEPSTVFYQLKEKGDYLVLLTEFEISSGGSNQNVRGHKNKKGKAKAGSSGEEPDVHKICSRNWNNVGKYIDLLCGGEGYSVNYEITHLVNKLKDEAVKYADLVWEAGIWDFDTKIYFLREIFWCYDKDDTRKADLRNRAPLGLQSCIKMFSVTEHANTTVILQDQSLLKSLFFLRVFIFAHQAEVLMNYSGPKDCFRDRRTAERFVHKERGDYMVRLIQEMRNLNWIKTSPYVRSRHNYMIDRYTAK